MLFAAGVKFCRCLLHTGSLKGKCFTEIFSRSTTNAHWGLQIEVTTKCSLWLRMTGTTVNCFGLCCVREGCQTFQASFSSLPEVSYPLLSILNSLNNWSGCIVGNSGMGEEFAEVLTYLCLWWTKTVHVGSGWKPVTQCISQKSLICTQLFVYQCDNIYYGESRYGVILLWLGLSL